MHGGDIVGFELKYGKKPLDFSANISPLGICDGIKNKIIANLDTFCEYPDPFCREMIDAISYFENVSKDTIICGNGAADLIFRLCYSLKPKKALILAPTFSEYEHALKSIDCEIEYFYLKKEEQFEVNIDILKQIKSDIDIVFICQPNNPTGKIIEKNNMSKILEKCIKNGVFLVVDECFIDFIEENEKFSMKNEDKSNIFILKAFTKMYALAGLRVGYGICYNKKLLKDMNTKFQPWSVSKIAQISAIQATKECLYVKKVLELIRIEKIYIENEFEKLGIYYIKSEANFILFFIEQEKFFEKMAKNGILLRDCSDYIGLSKGYYRVAIKKHSDNVKLIEILKKIFKECENG